MEKGERLLLWMVGISTIGLLAISQWFPWMFDGMQTFKEHETPWWQLHALSLPVFILWFFFLIKEIRRLIKKYKKNERNN